MQLSLDTIAYIVRELNLTFHSLSEIWGNPGLKEEIAILRKKIELQESSETGFMKYCRFGIPLLSNLSGSYTNVSLEIKQKLLGSIFPAKLHFCEDSYRTTPLNPALALI